MHRTIRPALSIAVVAALFACSKGKDTPADAGQQCTTLADCTGNGGRQVCLNSVCVNTCSSSSDCTSQGANLVCDEAICQLPACGNDSECGNSGSCVGGKCQTSPAATEVGSCQVSPNPADVAVGSSVKLKAVAQDSTGAPLHYNAVTWAATGPGTVGSDGSVTASGAGDISVTATVGSKTCASTVHAYAAAAASTLRVTVINMHTKEPVAGATVMICDHTGGCAAGIQTAADGTVSTGAYDVVSNDVHVFAPGYNYTSYVQTQSTDLLVALTPFVPPSLRSGFTSHMCDTASDDPTPGACPSPQGEFAPLQDQGEAVHLAFFGSGIPNSLLDLSVDTLVGPMHTVTLTLPGTTTSKPLTLPYGLVLGIGTNFFPPAGSVTGGTNDPRYFADGGLRSLWGIGGNINLSKVVSVLTPLLQPGATIDIGTLLPQLLGFFGRLESGAVVGVKAPANAAAGGTPTFAKQPVQLTTAMRLAVNAQSPKLPTLDGAYVDGVIAVAGAMQYPMGFVPLGLTAGISAKDGQGGVLDPTCDTSGGNAPCDTNLLPFKFAPENGGLEGSDVAVALLALNFGGLSPGSSTHIAVSGQITVIPNNQVKYTVPGGTPMTVAPPAFMTFPPSANVHVTRSTRNVEVDGDGDAHTQIYRFELENAQRLNWNLWAPPVGAAASRSFYLPNPGFASGPCDPMTQLCDPFADATADDGTTHGPSARLLALELTTADTPTTLESFANALHLDELGASLKAFTALQVDVNQ